MRRSGAEGPLGRAIGSVMHVGLQGQESMHVELQSQKVAADVNFFSGAAGPMGRAMGSAMHVGLQGQKGMHVELQSQMVAERPMKCVFVDLTGPYLTSAGGARYCMLMVDDYTKVGWTLFLGDKSGDTLCQAFRSWHTAVKRTAAIHGGLEIARFDNGNEFTNADFRKLLTELGVAAEYTPVDGAKRNDRVERKLALIAEGARAAWLEFPRHFPDLEFPAKANSWHQIWPEAFTWMNDCLNTTVQVHTPDKLSPYERLYKKRPTNRLLPFMMPGVRHHNRKNKAESKGERCFFLNSGNNHSSTTDKILLPSGIASYSADVT